MSNAVLKDKIGQKRPQYKEQYRNLIEGYAGFEYLQNKWDNENMKFRNPFMFVNFLEELNR